jgi:ligand-binding sensor domain-containing protein/signal transduction histidine kinase
VSQRDSDGNRSGWWVGCVICLAAVAPLRAEDDSPPAANYLVRVWGADEGLPVASVTDVTQTPEGYLWIGTLLAGLIRFDGVNFVSYTMADTPELRSMGVRRLIVDRNGLLWINTYANTLVTWDHGGFQLACTNSGRIERLLWSAPDRVTLCYADRRLLLGRKQAQHWRWQSVGLPGGGPQAQCCADGTGAIWYLRGEREIGIWADGKLKRLAPPPGLGEEGIKVLTADSLGHIWAGTDKSLAEWQADGFRVMTPTNGEPELDIKRIVPSGGGSLWVEANGRMRRCVGRRWLAESEGWNQQVVAAPALRFVQGDAKGGLWASGYSDLGLIHVLDSGEFSRVTTRDGLPSNAIQRAFQDREGNTWTGYERGGLVQIRRRLFQVIGRREGLSESLINSVCQDPRGEVWFGTYNGTVGRFEQGRCTNLTAEALTHGYNTSVAADAQGRVWIGAQGIGLLVYEKDEVRRVADRARLQGDVRLMLPTRDGHVWVGTLDSILRVTEGQVSPVYKARDAGEYPAALAEAADGTVWAGTFGGFLMRWDGNQFERLEPPDRSSLGRLWAIWPTAEGGLWIGASDGGLLRWRAGKFRRYTTKDGLPSLNINQVLEDREGNLWLSTRAGIARIADSALARFDRGEIATLRFSLYGQTDGLLTIGSAMEFQPNCWRGTDGTLLFAMANSVALVQPAEVRINPLPPTLVLEQVRLDEALVWPARSAAVISAASLPAESAAPLAPLKAGPERADLEFRYTGLSLGSPLRVRFKYRLEGLEADWNEAGSERKAVYRHVPPGDYVFRVAACNSDGIWNEQGLAFPLKVKPHFYQTVWFLGGAGAVAALSLALSVLTVTRRRLRRRLEQLEHQHELERERGRIAQDLHDDLGAGLTEIGLMGSLAQRPAAGAGAATLAANHRQGAGHGDFAGRNRLGAQSEA